MVVSTPERAILELLDELPHKESFHQADMLMEGLTSLSPRRYDPPSAEMPQHQGQAPVPVVRETGIVTRGCKRLDHSGIDLGSGKRMLVRGGKLDSKYLITVPRDLNAGG